MKQKSGPGVRCVNCGCRLDSGERCDCERVEAEKRQSEQAARRIKLVEKTRLLLEQAFAEYDAS